MFTGLIQDVGEIVSVTGSGSNIDFGIASQKLAPQIGIGDSVAISGACLTATTVDTRAGRFQATAVAETIARTKLGQLTSGDRVNLELSLRPTDRLGGHFVQGHVDATGVCLGVVRATGSWIVTLSYPNEFSDLLIEKGSIAVDGISLTAFNRSNDRFQVSVIPHTWENTSLSGLKTGELVNLEFDLIGKYILNYAKPSGREGLTIEKLIDSGF
jgi:riboflavin synthase